MDDMEKGRNRFGDMVEAFCLENGLNRYATIPIGNKKTEFTQDEPRIETISQRVVNTRFPARAEK